MFARFALRIILSFILWMWVATGLSKINFNQKIMDFVRSEYGEKAEKRMSNWHALVETLRYIDDDQEVLFEVNKFFNQITFSNDSENWRQQDYWATPIEFLGSNSGDCEDFVIAKYFTLIELGIPRDKLRFMYVTATRPNRQAHMVLAYYDEPDEIPLVLDNINKRILPASSRRDLIPIYSFNEKGLWLAKSQGQGRKMQNSNSNRRWGNLIQKMQSEYEQ